MPDLNWTAIVGVGTAVLAIIAFGSFWLQFYFSRKQIRVRLYLDTKEKWDSERMEQSRKALASYFMDSPLPRSDEFYKQMKERVPNFFEDLGSILRHKLVDEGLIYDLLSYHVRAWYTVCKPYFDWLQGKKKDTSLFDDFKGLYERMVDLEAKERKITRNQVELNEAEVKEFLEEEYDV